MPKLAKPSATKWAKAKARTVQKETFGKRVKGVMADKVL